MRNLASLAILLVLAGAARAQEDSVTASSREHFARGRELYFANHNAEALREFEAGFQEVPRPEFLINIGLCQLRLGHSREARDAFRKFLAAAPEGHRQRRNVEELLAAAEAAVAQEAEKAAHPEAAPPVTPEPPPQVAPRPAPPAVLEPPPASPVLVAAPPPRSFARRHWWIFPVVGVVVAGVAVGLGVGLTRPTGCAAQKGLCVDASQ